MLYTRLISLALSAAAFLFCWARQMDTFSPPRPSDPETPERPASNTEMDFDCWSVSVNIGWRRHSSISLPIMSATLSGDSCESYDSSCSSSPVIKVLSDSLCRRSASKSVARAPNLVWLKYYCILPQSLLLDVAFLLSGQQQLAPKLLPESLPRRNPYRNASTALLPSLGVVGVSPPGVQPFLTNNVLADRYA
ncbi:hypothetical protein CALVIDRAFT_323180 [Calocera viscosa TUFC12733]|uniref:Secreted protein n=1 Tax=Calocera viscosa (strain TUFC12733) TaxID=1330018 RepID=A0A167QQE1_CALVF|nr:hypothetical protein CALVIDRAFT_323180 [Calocera viscosa TUFC12733]